ncbi:hypothetical protein AB6A40_002697 [Gnathostoma spinigerum]|uniref:Uncharacterized protein n=1 Tax=Gnathostoma spinigerum TaxID=75299 RepID=A0ABD6EGC7_9BILA
MTFITVRPSLRNVVWCLLPTILLVTGIVAVVMGAVAVHKSVPDEYRRRIQEMTPLGISREDGGLNSRTVRWIEQGRLTRIQYWFFNYTNTLEIINRGSRPDFIEYGPYTYS